MCRCVPMPLLLPAQRLFSNRRVGNTGGEFLLCLPGQNGVLESSLMKRHSAERYGAHLIALLALVLACLVGSPAAAQASKPWRHGLIEPKSDAGILLMAARRGFYKQAGLDVEIVPVKDDQVLLKATIAGDLDSFEGGPSGALIAASRGADIKIIGCTWLMVPHGIFVHDDITAMDQLKGK